MFPETCHLSSGCISYDDSQHTAAISDFNVMLISLALHGLFYTSIVACLDSRVIRRLCTEVAFRLSPGFSAVVTANNVTAQRCSVRGLNHQGQECVLAVDNLTKLYYVSYRSKPRLGVKGLTFGVRAGECFGLIGCVGAEKTTLFRLLTAEVNATSGSAVVVGHDVQSEREHVSPTKLTLTRYIYYHNWSINAYIHVNVQMCIYAHVKTHTNTSSSPVSWAHFHRNTRRMGMRRKNC